MTQEQKGDWWKTPRHGKSVTEEALDTNMLCAQGLKIDMHASYTENLSTWIIVRLLCSFYPVHSASISRSILLYTHFWWNRCWWKCVVTASAVKERVNSGISIVQMHNYINSKTTCITCLKVKPFIEHCLNCVKMFQLSCDKLCFKRGKRKSHEGPRSVSCNLQRLLSIFIHFWILF